MTLRLVVVAAGLLLAQPACAQVGPGGPVSFTPSLDQRIAQATAATATPCNLQQAVIQALPGAGAWSAWQTDYCVLAELIVDPAHPYFGSYPVPVRLPNAAGRQLFLAGGTPVLLLEFEAARFRFVQVGNDVYISAPSVTHRFYPQPTGDLLQIANKVGDLATVSGARATFLSMLDIDQGQWVLNNLLTEVEEEVSGTRPTQVKRSYQVQDAGQTLVLGNYRLQAGAYKYAQLPPAVSRPEDAAPELPAGTYHLRAGQYHRVGSAEGTLAAIKPGRRLAVGAAEVNGTFRDERGREFTLLAVGAGRVQIAYQPHPTPLTGRFIPTGQALIQADSALYTARVGGCPLRFYFAQAGTLRVEAPGCTTQGAATPAGTYKKISSLKPRL